MNFLEQLVAEWYQYKDYFIRTNIKFGRRPKGGYIGEMDVVAYKPETQDFIHIEASTDASTWSERKKIFEKKFTDARRFYLDIFPSKQIDIKPKQIALVGFNLSPNPTTVSWKSSPPEGSPWGEIKIEVIHIPKFFESITAELKKKNPQNDAIPEIYPRLRAIQYAMFYINRKV